MDFIKAPWRYETQSGEIYGGKSDVLICDMLPTGDKVHEANAALIAAAPEMYEMLEDCMLHIFNECPSDEGKELIAKITGLRKKARGEK